ncbi:hypothetical protein [Sebaldella sp. S0638]|uniref:hypothetical protein n=1 Tax=Sebaldella sp. S0638 TaxID=2957809 RepID=UPI00209C7C6B|nr:hypothetical protein [Sebaldella sp. S0638]MCP1224638.1 hypothetical protein [Sebaldella sp. S0638]
MKRFFLHVILTMVVGGIVYILFRSDTLLMFRWFEFLKIDKIIYSLREYTFYYRKYIPESVLFSLPDCLWVYSFTMFLSFYFKNILLIMIPCIGSVLTEIGQLWFVPGTFDIMDVLYMLAATGIALFFIYRHRNSDMKQRKLSNQTV